MNSPQKIVVLPSEPPLYPKTLKPIACVQEKISPTKRSKARLEYKSVIIVLLTCKISDALLSPWQHQKFDG
ncbi:hypothetical protein Hanom_Chr17g01524201 [Helianthus anomalus]